MARLVGFIGNRPDLGPRALTVEDAALRVRLGGEPEAGAVSWGIGFYQGGEILLKRRPIDDRRSLGFADLAKELKADVLVGHVRSATVGSLRTENTHPFRYRQWLFAQTGTVPAFDDVREPLAESLPQFLARDVRGDTDAELVFHLFLSFLHDAGQLDRLDVQPAVARQAIRATVSLVDRLCAEQGQAPSRLNMVLATGDFVLGVRTGCPMAHQVLEGRSSLERLYGSESFSRTKIPHLMTARLSLVASDFDDDRVPEGWSTVPERATVTLTRLDAPVVESL